MFKAKFITYKPSATASTGYFTQGKEYDIEVVDNNGYYSVIDDLNEEIKFKSLFLGGYEFEVVPSQNNKIKVKDEKRKLKYFINGNLVTKRYFYESLGEVNEAESLGVKVSSVKFEIKFE